jgi:hypothetical protein
VALPVGLARYERKIERELHAHQRRTFLQPHAGTDPSLTSFMLRSSLLWNFNLERSEAGFCDPN